LRQSKRAVIPQKDIQELDKKLQELAVTDFEVFCKLFGINKTQAFVCFEVHKKKSFGQIAIKLKLSRTAVYVYAKKCPKSEDVNKKDNSK
jgi:hypothetical protein